MAYRNPEDAALGISGSSYALLFDCPRERPSGFSGSLEVGERRLFDIEGLESHGVRFGVRGKRLGIVVSAARTSAPVGGENLLGVEPLYLGNPHVSFSVGVNLNWLSFDGLPRVYLMSVSARMFARLPGGFVVGYTAETVRISGEALAGADSNLYLVVFAESPVCALARVGLKRDGAVDIGFSSRARIGRFLRAAVGYDDAAGILKGSLTLPLTSFGLSVGASLHPVLGLSKSLFVFWGWGS